MYARACTRSSRCHALDTDSLRREGLAEADGLRAALEERAARLQEAERMCRDAEAAIDELQRGKDALLHTNAAIASLQREHANGRSEVQALLATTQVAAQEAFDISAQVRKELVASVEAQRVLGQEVVRLRAEEARLLSAVEEHKDALRLVEGEYAGARSALQVLLLEKEQAHETLSAVLSEMETRKARRFMEDEQERERDEEERERARCLLAQWEGVGEILNDPTIGLWTINRRMLHLVHEQCADDEDEEDEQGPDATAVRSAVRF